MLICRTGWSPDQAPRHWRDKGAAPAVRRDAGLEDDRRELAGDAGHGSPAGIADKETGQKAFKETDEVPQRTRC